MNIHPKLSSSSMFSKLELSSLALTCRQLSMTLQSGISILEALDLLIRTSKHHRLNRFLSDLRMSIAQGGSLTDGMKRWRHAIPAAIFPIIETGESTGRLAQSFQSCAEICEMTERTRREIRGALIYPIFLMIFSFFALSAPLFVVSGPVAYLKAVFTPIICIAAAVLVIGGVVRILNAAEAFRELIIRLTRHIPYLGPAFIALESARFTWMLASCIRSGLDIQESLRLSAQSTADPGLIRTIDSGRRTMLTKGQSLSDLLASIKWLPSIVLQMTVAGETSGTMPEMLEKVHEILRMEGLSKIKDFLKILPVILFLGVAVYLATVIVRFWSGHFAGLENLTR